MEIKYCYQCDKAINFISNAMYDEIIIFCCDECLQNYNDDLQDDKTEDIKK
jgi:hypothetical protein